MRNFNGLNANDEPLKSVEPTIANFKWEISRCYLKKHSSKKERMNPFRFRIGIEMRIPERGWQKKGFQFLSWNAKIGSVSKVSYHFWVSFACDNDDVSRPQFKKNRSPLEVWLEFQLEAHFFEFQLEFDSLLSWNAQIQKSFKHFLSLFFSMDHAFPIAIFSFTRFFLLNHADRLFISIRFSVNPQRKGCLGMNFQRTIFFF